MSAAFLTMAAAEAEDFPTMAAAEPIGAFWCRLQDARSGEA